MFKINKVIWTTKLKVIHVRISIPKLYQMMISSVAKVQFIKTKAIFRYDTKVVSNQVSSNSHHEIKSYSYSNSSTKIAKIEKWEKFFWVTKRGNKGIINRGSLRYFKSGQKYYKPGPGFPIGTKGFPIGVRDYKSGKRDFKSWRDYKLVQNNFHIFWVIYSRWILKKKIQVAVLKLFFLFLFKAGIMSKLMTIPALVYFSRSSHRRGSVKKVFLKILQNSQENTCVEVSLFNKATGLMPAILLKTRLRHRCFLVNFAKFLRGSVF